MPDITTSIVDIVNNVNLGGIFSGLKLGDCLYYCIKGLDGAAPSLMMSFARIIKRTALQYYSFEEQGSADTLFLFSESYGLRNDHLETFDRITGLAASKLVMKPAGRKKVRLLNLTNLSSAFALNKKLKPVIEDKRLRWFAVQNLHTISEAFEEYVSYCKKRKIDCSKLASYVDVHAVDSFFTQKFNAERKLTVTMQHGTYSTTSNNGPWPFLGSHSDVFFANSKFAFDEARRAGYNTDRIRIVGLPSYIGEKRVEKPQSFSATSLGLFLDGGSFLSSDRILLENVQSCCKRMGVKLLVKLHPASDKKDYVDIIDKDVVEKFYSSEISVFDFLDMIDVAVVHGSTTLLECLRAWVPTFVFEESTGDIYYNAKLLKVHSGAELEERIKKINSKSSIEEIAEAREYFCGSGNEKDNYLKELHKLGIV